MGGIGKALFGGGKSTQTSESGNKFADWAMNTLGGNTTLGNTAYSTLGSLLGLGGNQQAADDAFKNYLDSSGFQFALDTGSKAITGNAAARGLLNSGATAKALTQYGQNLGQQSFNNYLNQLGNVFTGGLQSAQQVIGAGQYGTQTGKSSSQGGIIPALFG